MIESEKLAEALNGEIPEEVDHLLNWGVEKFKSALADQLDSVILYAGVAQGDYSPRWSNINVCFALTGEILPELAAYLIMVSEEMRLRFIKGGQGGWNSGQTLEGVLIPADLLKDPVLSSQVYCFGRQGGKTIETNLRPFDRELIARHGITIWGEEIDTPPAEKDGLCHQTEQGLSKIDSPPLRMLDSPVWLLERIFWIARTLHFWSTGEIASKKDALAAQSGRGKEFADAFKFAQEMRDIGSVDALNHEQQTRFHFTMVAHQSADEIRRLAEL